MAAMRVLALFAALSLKLGAADPQEKEVLAIIQSLFDGMAARDAGQVKSAFTTDARLIASRDGKLRFNLSRDEFASRIAAGSAPVLERIWEPKVLIRDRIANVWAEYDVHVNGRFAHCGIDTFLLIRTDEGWRIFSLGSTMETTGCKPSPLGPPKD